MAGSELIPQPHGGALRRGNPRPGGWPGCGRPPSRVWRDSVRAAYAGVKSGLVSPETFGEILDDAQWRSAARGDKRGELILACWILDRNGI